MKKKVLSSLLVASMVACLFAGCSSTTSSSSNNSGSGDKDQATTAGKEEGGDKEEATKPTMEDYGKGEILIWAPEAAVEFTKTTAEKFIADHKEYSGYTVRVEPVSEADAAKNAIADLEAAADIYSFAQDQLGRIVSAGALTPLTGAYADVVAKNNMEGAVVSSQLGGQTYAFPVTADNGYFIYYDNTVITNPDSLEQIIADCEKAGKSIYFEVNNGWYQPAFFFGTDCVLTYDTNNEGGFTKCNIDYNSEKGLVALREMIDLTNSPAFVNGSSTDNATNPGVVVTGAWNKESATKKFVDADGNSVLGVAKLPEFEGCDGKTYQLSGFSGFKLMGVKPQTEVGKAIVCLDLAEYLTSEEIQLSRFNELGWGPSNLKALENKDVQADATLAALGAQSLHAIPQGQYPGDYWTRATALGDECITKNLTPSTSDDDLKKILEQFQKDCESYATAK
jgi:arabinogalactan oligomer/maltooligosaccharide transport system substrate-binding protein